MFSLLGAIFGKDGLFGYLNKRGERQVTAQAAFQDRLKDDKTSFIIVLWMISIMTGFFIPIGGCQENTAEGFRLMGEHLPPSWEENWHVIIGAIFTIQGGKFYLKHRFRAIENPNTKYGDPVATRTPTEILKGQ